jgi:hypothetical protein
LKGSLRRWKGRLTLGRLVLLYFGRRGKN